MENDKTDEEPVIVIPGPGDPRLGYLHTANIHFPFVLEDKTWKTVEHFMLAKRFEGTMLEEEIRKSKNVCKARILAKPRRVMLEKDGRVVKKILYGRLVGCVEREDWESVKNDYLERSIRAKFLQNKRALARLLKTEGIRIIDGDHTQTKGVNTLGSILEKIRDSVLEERASVDGGRSKKSIRKFAAPYADLKVLRASRPDDILSYETEGLVDLRSSFMTDEERRMVRTMLSAIDILREVEGIPKNVKVSIEMFEDVFYNFLGEPTDDTLKLSIEILGIIKNWIAERSKSWTEVTRNMPHYESLMREIEEIVKLAVGQETPAASRVKISIFIATIIRWLRMDSTVAERNTFFIRAQIIKKENFVLPPLRRSYRVHAIPVGEKIEKSSNVKLDPTPEKKKDMVKHPRQNEVPLTTSRTTGRKDDYVVADHTKEVEKHALRGAYYIELFRKTHNLTTQDFSVVVNHLEKMKRRARTIWLESFCKLDMQKQKEELKNIISKTTQSTKHA